MKNELYHSDTYLGEDYSDGIRHFKYVKKEKRNGRWVYYYSDAEYEKAKREYNNAKKDYNKASSEYKKNQSQIEKYDRDEKLARVGKNMVGSVNTKGFINKYRQKRIVKAYESAQDRAHDKKWQHINKRKDLVDKELNAYDKEQSAKYKYEQTANKDKIRKTAAKAIVKTANKLSITSQKAKNNIKKGKKKLDKLFSKNKKKK